jgi:hypothetical protein
MAKKCYWDNRFNCYHPNEIQLCLTGSMHPGVEACEELTAHLKQVRNQQFINRQTISGKPMTGKKTN